MILPAFQRTIQDDAGNIVPLAEINVFIPGTSDRATLFSDDAGNEPLTNPFNSDAEGFAQFYAEPGEYDVTATGPAGSRTLGRVLLHGQGAFKPTVQSLPDITALASLNPDSLVEGQQVSVGEFWPGTGVGGGTLTWRPEEPKANHNGGTIIDPDKVSELGAIGEFNDYFTPAGSGVGCWLRPHSARIAASEFGVIESLQDASPVLNLLPAVAAGRQIVVDAPVTMLSGLSVSDSSLDVTFLYDVDFPTDENISWISVRNNYEHTLSVSSLAEETAPFLSGEFDSATKLTVSGNIPADAVGRVVRVVSDDVDPYSDGADNRIGESAIVALVDGDAIWLAGTLEDETLYSTNVRVAFLNRHRVRISAKQVVGGLENTSPRIYLQACSSPSVTAHFEGITGTGVLSIGNYLGVFDVIGTNHRNANAAFGYLVNDVSGYNCVMESPRADRCRHVTTTNFNDTTANDSRIERYGACRFHTVKTGHAGWAEASAFDSHAGSRYSRWINCSADHVKVGERGGTSSLIQIRGYRETVEGGICGPDVLFFARVMADAVNPTIVNPTSYARRFLSIDGNTVEGNCVSIQGGYCAVPAGFFFAIRGTQGARIVMHGTTIKAHYSANQQIFDLSASHLDAKEITFLLETDLEPGSTRLIRYRDGHCDIRLSGNIQSVGSNNHIANVLDDGGSGEVNARVKLHTDGSINPASGPVTGSYEYLIVREDPQAGGVGNTLTTATDLDEYLRHLATV